MMIKGRHDAMQRQMKRLLDRERKAKLARVLDAHIAYELERKRQEPAEPVKPEREGAALERA